MDPQEISKKPAQASEMRRAWFDFVRKTRQKLSKKKKENVSHRDAMKAASTGWVAEKAKILRKKKREAKKNAS